jgi:cytoskeletal protein RodZ
MIDWRCRGGQEMGSFSIWHWIIVLVFLSLPLVIGLVVWLIIRAVRKNAPAPPSSVPSGSNTSRGSTESRLQQLADLKAKGLITQAEYERQRSAIIALV